MFILLFMFLSVNFAFAVGEVTSEVNDSSTSAQLLATAGENASPAFDPDRAISGCSHACNLLLGATLGPCIDVVNDCKGDKWCAFEEVTGVGWTVKCFGCSLIRLIPIVYWVVGCEELIALPCFEPSIRYRVYLRNAVDCRSTSDNVFTVEEAFFDNTSNSSSQLCCHFIYCGCCCDRKGEAKILYEKDMEEIARYKLWITESNRHPALKQME